MWIGVKGGLVALMMDRRGFDVAEACIALQNTVWVTDVALAQPLLQSIIYYFKMGGFNDS